MFDLYFMCVYLPFMHVLFEIPSFFARFIKCIIIILNVNILNVKYNKKTGRLSGVAF